MPDVQCETCGILFPKDPCLIKRSKHDYCSMDCRDKRNDNAPEKMAKHFWAGVDVRGPDECWPWKRSKTSRGYGKFCWNKQIILAHRAAFELTHGPIPEGRWALHSCDNPPCCNAEDHLYLGDHRQNMNDIIDRGRQRGERNGAHILTEDQVKTILHMGKDIGWDKTVKILSHKYQVHRLTIYAVLTKTNWSHISI